MNITDLSEIVNIEETKDFLLELIPRNSDEFLEIGSEISKTLKIINNAKTFYNEYKIKAFLQSWYSNPNFKESDRQKIYEYLEIPKNRIFIHEIIDSAINSKSIKCSAILGYYAGKILSERKPVEYKDRLVINGLRVMFDEDLDIFCEIYDYYQKNPEIFNDKEGNHFKSVRISDIIDRFENHSFTQSDAEISFEKLKGAQIAGYDIGGFGGVGNAWGSFLFNDYSHYFYEIVISSNQLNFQNK